MNPLVDVTLVGEATAVAPPPDPGAAVLLLGVGNLLMGDEGVGVHVLRRVADAGAIPGVRVLDGGTGGANLLGEFERRRAVILVDATRDGSPAGTVRYRYRRHQRIFDLPAGLSAHDFGLKDLFAAAALLESLPEVHLFTVAVETVRPMHTTLSPEVAAVVPGLAARLVSLARSLASVA